MPARSPPSPGHKSSKCSTPPENRSHRFHFVREDTYLAHKSSNGEARIAPPTKVPASMASSAPFSSNENDERFVAATNLGQALHRHAAHTRVCCKQVARLASPRRVQAGGPRTPKKLTCQRVLHVDAHRLRQVCGHGAVNVCMANESGQAPLNRNHANASTTIRERDAIIAARHSKSPPALPPISSRPGSRSVPSGTKSVPLQIKFEQAQHRARASYCRRQVPCTTSTGTRRTCVAKKRRCSDAEARTAPSEDRTATCTVTGCSTSGQANRVP